MHSCEIRVLSMDSVSLTVSSGKKSTRSLSFVLDFIVVQFFPLMSPRLVSRHNLPVLCLCYLLRKVVKENVTNFARDGKGPGM